jgi:hypothetical protein
MVYLTHVPENAHQKMGEGCHWVAAHIVCAAEDPIGLLPPRLILGINKRGVHFFRPVPKEYLHSAELRDIMQFGSSSNAVFFKMRVAGVLHIFQFETRQGEDICMALQTHINDIMMKRYNKVRLWTVCVYVTLAFRV